jgi:hypothetical protein
MIKRQDLLCLKLLQSKKFSKAALRHLLDESTVRAIAECALNLLKGKLRVSPRHKNKLSQYKNELRYLVDGKSKERKKKIIIQKGDGFLPFLLAPAISLISSLFSKN